MGLVIERHGIHLCHAQIGLGHPDQCNVRLVKLEPGDGVDLFKSLLTLQVVAPEAVCGSRILVLRPFLLVAVDASLVSNGSHGFPVLFRLFAMAVTTALFLAFFIDQFFRLFIIGVVADFALLVIRLDVTIVQHVVKGQGLDGTQRVRFVLVTLAASDGPRRQGGRLPFLVTINAFRVIDPEGLIPVFILHTLKLQGHDVLIREGDLLFTFGMTGAAILLLFFERFGMLFVQKKRRRLLEVPELGERVDGEHIRSQDVRFLRFLTAAADAGQEDQKRCAKYEA